MQGIIISLIGWFIVLFLHLHILRRDEVSRKKDRLQSELNDLLVWCLDTPKLLSSSGEIRETYLASKVSLIELRFKELFEKYFNIESGLSFSSIRTVDVYNVTCGKSAQDIQIELINVVTSAGEKVEEGYSDYCKNAFGYKKIFKIIESKSFSYLIVFFLFFIATFSMVYLLIIN